MVNSKESPIPDYASLRKLDELRPLRGLAATTHEQYRRFARKLAERAGRDPAELDEAAVRAHLLTLKTRQNYAPSTMRAACAALRFLYHTVLGRDWQLFDLVRCADHHRLPVVLTREEVARLFAVVRLPRFRTFLRLVYGCGLRLSEALALDVDSIKQNGACLYIREGKGGNPRRSLPGRDGVGASGTPRHYPANLARQQGGVRDYIAVLPVSRTALRGKRPAVDHKKT